MLFTITFRSMVTAFYICDRWLAWLAFGDDACPPTAAMLAFILTELPGPLTSR